MLFILFFSFQCWVMFPCYLYIHIYFPSVDCSIIFLVVFYGLYQVFLFELLLVPMLNNVVNALLTTVLYIFNFWFLRSLCFVKFDNYIFLSISFRISPFHFFSFVFLRLIVSFSHLSSFTLRECLLKLLLALVFISLLQVTTINI